MEIISAIQRQKGTMKSKIVVLTHNGNTYHYQYDSTRAWGGTIIQKKFSDVATPVCIYSTWNSTINTAEGQEIQQLVSNANIEFKEAGIK